MILFGLHLKDLCGKLIVGFVSTSTGFECANPVLHLGSLFKAISCFLFALLESLGSFVGWTEVLRVLFTT